MRRRSRVTRVVVAATAVVILLGLPSAEASFRPLDQDQRISFMGPNGDPFYDATDPAVAYNPTANEYLVVWSSDDNTPPLVDDELEIYAQRISATGAPVGGRIRVSTQGADGNPDTEVDYPSVAYNSTANEYLIVWLGENGVTAELEIWAQRLSANGVEVGGSNFQISDMGPDGDAGYVAYFPSAVYNATADEYFVVWYGDDNTPPLVDNEFEIFGQRLTGTGAQTGANDFRISEQGADGNPDSSAGSPSVAYNAATNEYLVVWSGEIGTTNAFEIWAQRLSATGVEVGGNDFQISDLGPPGDGSYDAGAPTVVANPSANEYLAVWHGNDDTGLLDVDEFEIYGQRLTGAGAQTGADDFRISDVGGSDGNPNYDAYQPQVVYAPLVNEFLVVWWGDDDVPPLQNQQFEVFGQRVTAAGLEAGQNDLVISEPGGGMVSVFTARFGVADNGPVGEALVVWPDEITTDGEIDIFGRRLGAAPPVLAATDPPGSADQNNPRLKGSVDPDSTVDVFKNATCAGAPAVNDAPAADLNGAGIAVSVADNSVTAFSATASSDGRTSRCSNSISYSEVTPSDPAPVVSGFAVSPRRFRAGGPSSFRFRLSEPATTRIVIERSFSGRRVGQRCLPPTPKRRKRPRCTRFVRVGTVTFRNRPAGTNRIGFRGRIGRRGLKPGTYLATITATDAAGQRSVPRRAAFTILRRRT